MSIGWNASLRRPESCEWAGVPARGAQEVSLRVPWAANLASRAALARVCTPRIARGGQAGCHQQGAQNSSCPYQCSHAHSNPRRSRKPALKPLRRATRQEFRFDFPVLGALRLCNNGDWCQGPCVCRRAAEQRGDGSGKTGCHLAIDRVQTIASEYDVSSADGGAERLSPVEHVALDTRSAEQLPVLLDGGCERWKHLLRIGTDHPPRPECGGRQPTRARPGSQLYEPAAARQPRAPTPPREQRGKRLGSGPDLDGEEVVGEQRYHFIRRRQ
eukprot:scaffold223541_cov25-Tisochrysis_lutea.AAC.2